MFQPEPEPDPSEEASSEVEPAGSADVEPAGSPDVAPAGAPESVPADQSESLQSEASEVVLPPPPEEPPPPVYEDVPLPVEVPKWVPQDVFTGPSDTPVAAPDEPVSGATEPAEAVAEVPAPKADDAPSVEPLLPAPLDLSPSATVPEPVAEVPAVPEPVAEVPAVPEPIAEVPAVPEPVAEVPPATEVPGPFPFTPAPVPEAAPAQPAPPVAEAVTEPLPPVPPPPIPVAAAESLPPVPPAVPEPPATPGTVESSLPEEAAEPALDPMFRSAAPSAPAVEDAAAAAAVAAPFGAPAAPAAEEAPAVAEVPEQQEPEVLADVSTDYADASFDEPGLAPVIPIDMDGKWVAGKGRGARSSGQERSKRGRGLALKRSKDENPFEVVGDPAAETAVAAAVPAEVSPAPAEGKKGFGREIRFGRKKKEAAPAAAAPAGWESAPGAIPQAVPAQHSEGDAMWGAAPAAAAVWGAPPAAAPAAPAASPASVPAPPAGAVPPPPPGAVPQTLPTAPGFGDSTEAPFPAPEYTPPPAKRGLQLPSFFTKRSSGGGSRNKMIAIIVVAALVAAGLGYMFLGRGGGATTPAFALDLSAGQSYTYRMNVAIDAHVYAGGRSVPVNETMGATMKWDVQSVDAQGNATVAVDLSDFTVNMNGQSVPVGSMPKEATHFTMRVAPDGSILQGGSLGMFGGGNASTAGGVPGTDQFTPVLPGHDVTAGATWTKTYSQTLPYGMGTIHAKTRSTYLRNESVDGANAAVIVSKTTIPLHMKINLRQMLQQLGSSGGTSLPAGANPVMSYKGKVKAQTTGWFDPNARQMLKTSMTAQFGMHIAISGVPGGMPGGLNDMTMRGAMTMTMEKV